MNRPNENWFTALQKKPTSYRLFLTILLLSTAWFPYQFISKDEVHMGKLGTQPILAKAKEPVWYWTMFVVTSLAPIGVGVLLVQSLARPRQER